MLEWRKKVKKYYVLKGKNNYFLLDKREFSKIEEYKEKYPSYILKGFYNKEEALEYANSEFYGRNFYIVKVGRNPGIYTSREDVIREVSNYPNALVMNAKTMEKAEELFKLDIEKFKILKEEKNKGKKTSSKKNKDFVKINETEILKKRKQIIKEMKNKLSNSNYVAFIDCEANNQFAISIGLVIYSLIEEKIVDTYYSLVKPNNFSKMDEYIQRMTNITNDMVLNAPEIGFVINQIEKFLNKYNIQYIFSCGKSDKSFLQKHSRCCL